MDRNVRIPSPEIATALGVSPVMSSPEGAWKNVALQRFRDMRRDFEVPGLENDVLVAHLAGPFLERAHESNEQRWIGAGDLGVNPAGMPVIRTITGQPDVAVLHLDPASVRSVAAEVFDVDPTLVTLVPKLAEPDETVHRIALLLLSDTTTPLFVEALSRALIVHVLQRHSNLAPRRAQPRAVLSSGRAKRVIDHMHAHLDADLSLAELAGIAGLSTSRFSQAFRAATGRPPHRFLIDLRIETARQLLEDSDLSIIEIALRCGFEQPSHFATSFRRAMGMSPRAWRTARRS